MLRKSARHFGGADVIGDVALERFTRQAERAVTRRNGVGRVIADDERATVERAWNRLEGRVSSLGRRGINSIRLHLRDCPPSARDRRATKVDRAVLDFVKGRVFDPTQLVIRANGVCRLNAEMGRMVVAKVST